MITDRMVTDAMDKLDNMDDEFMKNFSSSIKIPNGDEICKIENTHRKLTATFEIDTDDIGAPMWNGSVWKYKGRRYRSLRELRTKSDYKVERFITKTLGEEIKKELDRAIIERIFKNV